MAQACIQLMLLFVCSFGGNPGLCGSWLSLPCHESRPTERGKYDLQSLSFYSPSLPFSSMISTHSGCASLSNEQFSGSFSFLHCCQCSHNIKSSYSGNCSWCPCDSSHDLSGCIPSAQSHTFSRWDT